MMNSENYWKISGWTVTGYEVKTSKAGKDYDYITVADPDDDVEFDFAWFRNVKVQVGDIVAVSGTLRSYKGYANLSADDIEILGRADDQPMQPVEPQPEPDTVSDDSLPF